MLRRPEQVFKGMRMDQVESILGAPDRIRSFSFGGDTWTTWTYHLQGKPLFVWFDRHERVRLRSVKRAV